MTAAKAKKGEPYLKEGNGHVDVELSRPLEIDGAKVAKLRMREPLVADQLAIEEMKGTDAEKELTMFANLCQVAPEDIKQLPLRDYRRLQVASAVFID